MVLKIEDVQGLISKHYITTGKYPNVLQIPSDAVLTDETRQWLRKIGVRFE